MSSPRKIKSKAIAELREHRDPVTSARIRTSMIIAARITTALEEKGWNKIRLATELKKNPSLVTRWLSGGHNFTMDTLIEIQQVLGISLFNLEIPPANAQASVIVAQHSSMNIREKTETYLPLSHKGERQFGSIMLQPGIRIFSSSTLVPN